MKMYKVTERIVDHYNTIQCFFFVWFLFALFGIVLLGVFTNDSGWLSLLWLEVIPATGFLTTFLVRELTKVSDY